MEKKSTCNNLKPGLGDKAHYHLPGLFEFFDFYRVFLPFYMDHRDYFYPWCDISSIYGAPADCIWGGGRVGEGNYDYEEVRDFYNAYNISCRLTLSNSLLTKEYLNDKKCNELCRTFSKKGKVKNGAIVHSEILTEYLLKEYPNLYLVLSTTRVETKFEKLLEELSNLSFMYIVPDFRLNKDWKNLDTLTCLQKKKIEFLCNECCPISCLARKECYESVSRICLGISSKDHICPSSDRMEGYRFSKAMESQAFIGIQDILNIYIPKGFNNFKIEGRGLGNAILLEFILYYMTKSEFQLKVREGIYLDSMLDLF